ncbi:voltage-gated ion channel [Lithospermum erythrorhizon]|uniref:Voltage-dependent anion-selective channel protein n=1 Tax=Lithospermum erythrorhizon TaxID=34254 RepID=A0AAV3Q937_LITER
MSKGPLLFTDIGKKAKDLLTRDYITDHKLSVSTYSHTGLALTSTAVKKGGLSTGDVGAVYNYKDTLIDVKVDTASNISTTFTATDFIPSTKTIASLKFPNYESGKLEIQYFHPHASLTTAVGFTKSPTVDASVSLGNSTFAVGAEAGYDTTSSTLTKYTAGVSLTKLDSCASIIVGDKGDSISASYVHYFDQFKRSAGVGEITKRFSTNENFFTVGGAVSVDHLTLVKLKLNNHGKLGAVLQHELMPKSLLTIGSEFDTKALDKAPRFGVSLALKP